VSEASAPPPRDRGALGDGPSANGAARQPGAASARTGSPTPPFLWAAIVLALVPGFGLGGALFGHRAVAWWVAAAQAHGHVQLFGWAGVLVLGVGLHFLPRLRGTALVAPALARWVLGLYGGGVALRAVAQPVAAIAPGAGALVAGSGLLELAGASLAVGMLAATLRRGPALQQRAGIVPVLPYLVLAFASLWLSLALNLAGLVSAASAGAALVAAPWQPLLLQLGLVGFLVPVCLAVSVRTFPLYLRVRVPPTRGLWAVWAVLLAGLVLRLAALLGAPLAVDGGGQLLQGGALLAAAGLLDAPLGRTRAAVLATTAARARALGATPRALPPPGNDVVAADALLRSAYAWLVVAAALLLLGGVLTLADGPPLPTDVERHALGAGFVTLLILGMGVRLLPGFLGRSQVASARLVWASFWLGNAAALLRVGPVLIPWLLALAGGAAEPSLAPWLARALALSGVLGMAAVACLGWNLWRTFR
jgi:uncharacterized protein involved in response to NO